MAQPPEQYDEPARAKPCDKRYKRSGSPTSRFMSSGGLGLVLGNLAAWLHKSNVRFHVFGTSIKYAAPSRNFPVNFLIESPALLLTGRTPAADVAALGCSAPEGTIDAPPQPASTNAAMQSAQRLRFKQFICFAPFADASAARSFPALLGCSILAPMPRSRKRPRPRVPRPRRRSAAPRRCRAGFGRSRRHARG